MEGLYYSIELGIYNIKVNRLMTNDNLNIINNILQMIK